MKKVLNIFSLWCLVVFAAGCAKEAPLTPTEEPEKEYGDHTLPQGNHAYDATIVDWFSKYNTLFLYKYVPNDLYYNISGYTGGVYDAASNKTIRPGLFDIPADEQYIGMQLDLIKETWLNFYPESLLRQAMPKKVFLVDSFFLAYNGAGKPVDNLYESYESYRGADHFVVTWGGARLQNITAAEKYYFKSMLNTTFLTYAYSINAIKHSTAFQALTDYSVVNWGNYREHGIIYYYYGGVAEDWNSYVETIVSNSYAALTAPGSVLDPATDTKGIYRKKYDAVIAYFKLVFNIDLQAIGNAGA